MLIFFIYCFYVLFLYHNSVGCKARIVENDLSEIWVCLLMSQNPLSSYLCVYLYLLCVCICICICNCMCICVCICLHFNQIREDDLSEIWVGLLITQIFCTVISICICIFLLLFVSASNYEEWSVRDQGVSLYYWLVLTTWNFSYVHWLSLRWVWPWWLSGLWFWGWWSIS